MRPHQHPAQVHPIHEGRLIADDDRNELPAHERVATALPGERLIPSPDPSTREISGTLPADATQSASLTHSSTEDSRPRSDPSAFVRPPGDALWLASPGR